MSASEELKELISVGPFVGLDATTAPLSVKPGYAASAIGCNPKIIPGALVPERGRVQAFDANAVGVGHVDSISIIYPCMGNANHPYLLCQGLNGNTVVTFLVDMLTMTGTSIANATKFTQATQFQGVVYTNGGQRFFLNGDQTRFYTWQYTASAIAQNIAISYSRAQDTVSLTGSFSVPETFTVTIDGHAIVYTSTLTVGGATIAPDNTVQALIANIANNINQYYQTGGGAGFVNKIWATVDPLPPPGTQRIILTSIFTGLTGNARTLTVGTSSTTATFTAGGPTFSGGNANVGSLDTKAYQYVLTQQTTMPDGTISETSVYPNDFVNPITVVIGTGNNNAIILNDTHSPPQYLFTGFNADGSAYTTNVYRRSFPIGTGITGSVQFQLVANLTTNFAFVDTFSDAELASHPFLSVHRDAPPVVTNSNALTNFGFLYVWRNRLFVLALVDDADTLNAPQTQLWPSNIGRGWEFDDTQAILVDSDMTVAPEASGPNYDDTYGNYPKGLGEVGSYLGVWKHRETWQVWGDGSTQNPFVAKRAFTIGAASSGSIFSVAGGTFWTSESGDEYFWGGTEPQNIENAIRNVKALTPLNAGISPADLAQSTHAWSNRILYLCFPTLGYSFGYDMDSSDWTSQLPYAPNGARAIYSTPSSPTTTTAKQVNEVLAVRKSAPSIVDWWFADPNNDLGVPAPATWVTPQMDSGDVSWQKWARTIQLVAPQGQGQVEVVITGDDGQGSTQVGTLTFDLNGDWQSKIKPLLGDGYVNGFVFSVKIVALGKPGSPAPIIWGVKVFGNLNRRLPVSS